MGRLLEKWSVVIVNNYFLLFAINGFLAMIGMKYAAKLDLLIMLAASVLTASYLLKKMVFFDFLVIVFIGVLALSGYVKDYDESLWYLGCRTELYFIIFFFVGKHPSMRNLDIIRKGIVPFLIVCLIGLYLYFTSPSWYMEYKMEIWSDQDDAGRFLEMSRLSAFWPYPYWVSYGSTIIYMYIMYLSYKVGTISKKNICIMVFLVLITLLSQQRTPLAAIAFITIFYCVTSIFFRKRTQKRTMFGSLLILLILIMCIAVFAFNIISDEMRVRLLDKLEAFDNAQMFLKDRTNIFRDFRTKEISLLGDGIGRYSHGAYFLGKSAITDQQYMKMLYEIGILGCIGYGFIFLVTILKGLRNIKGNIFELLIIAFYLVAMTGANCLAVFEQHIAIFWICCGLVFSRQMDNGRKLWIKE